MTETTNSRSRRVELLELVVVSLPYVACSYWVGLALEPIKNADFPAYHWEGALTSDFFTGRSMTQRLWFWVLGQNERLIAVAQLGMFWALAILAERTLRLPGAHLRNFSVAAVIAFSATSFNLGLSSIWVIPAPMFLALFGALALALVRSARGGSPWWVAAAGIPFVFSKNLAPPMAIAAVCAVAIHRFDRRALERPLRVLKAAASPHSLVILSAVASMWFTQRYDTSVGLNAANVVFRRVLEDPRLEAHFERVHGMPDDPVEKAVRGRNVLVKVRGEPIYGTNPDTGNLELHNFGPLSVWLSEQGQRVYLEHLLLHAPLEAWSLVRWELQDRLGAEPVESLAAQTATHPISAAAVRHNAMAFAGEGETVDFDESWYLEHHPDVADAVKTGHFASGREHFERFGRSEGRAASGEASVRRALPRGLLGFDPLAALVTAGASLGLYHPELYLLTIGLLLFAARKYPHLPGLLLSAILVSAAFPGLVIGVLAEAFGEARHLAVPAVGLALGLGSAALELLVRRAVVETPDAEIPAASRL